MFPFLVCKIEQIFFYGLTIIRTQRIQKVILVELERTHIEIVNK